jgi:hypothetical protein
MCTAADCIYVNTQHLSALLYYQATLKWAESLRQLLATVLQVPKVALSSADHGSFAQYAECVRQNRKQEAARLADARSKR